MSAGTQSLFRSEDMKFVQLTMSEATAHATLSAIGQLGCLHLNDLSGHEKGGGDSAQGEAYLHYKKRVAACFHWEKRLQALRQAMTDNGVEPPPLDYPECERAVPVPDVVGACAAYVESVEEPLMQNLLFKKQQSQRIHEHIERQHVLEKVRATQLFRRKADADANGPAAAAAPSDRDIEFGATGSAAADADRQRLLGAAAAGVHPGVAMDAKALEASQAGALGGSGSGAFSTLSGVIAVERQPFFERMLFRVSRGNAMAKFVPIEARLVDPATGEEAHKSVFTVLFVGRALGARIAKICQYVGATTVQIPADELSYNLELQDIQRRIDDFTGVLERTKHDIVKLLQAVAFDEHESFPLAGAAAGAGAGASAGGGGAGGGGRMGKSYNTFGNEMLRVSPLVNWECAIAREKAICDALRKCVLPQPGSAAAVVYAEGFVPAADAPRLAEVMRAIHDKYAQSVCDINALERYHNPPTYFRVNKFTETFQSIVNTYGWPRYKEANPGLFTIFTFPFLFGVMYGDIGHGTLLTLFALYLIWREDEYLRQQARRELGEIFGMAFGGRYLLVAMGACAVYCGIMYNDCFSIPWNVYGSTWHYDAFAPGADSREAKRVGTVYPVGIDPTWYGAKNELTFFNSLKMKLAVTIGVIQMSFGLVLQLTNHIHNGDMLGVFFEFVPQFLFLFCTFGYMIILIAIKLTTNWNEAPIAPPNLIQTMIGMFLSPGSVPSDKLMYGSQATVQLAFLLIAFLSVPVMLFVRPCWEHFGAPKKHGREHGHEASAHGDDDDANGFGADEKHLLHDSKAKDKEKDRRKGSGAAAAGGGGGSSSGGGAEEGHGFGDLFIHQTIHTIEFVLGTVSNTASYLRLWALSLAHAELSTVFWEKMIMQYGVLMGSPVTVVIGFAIWATATFAVLMGMDVLECFLHALRLHWVEFQNKFFHADGYAFQPFDFKKPTETA